MATGGAPVLTEEELQDKEIDEGWRALLQRTHSPAVHEILLDIKETFHTEADKLNKMIKKLADLRMSDPQADQHYFGLRYIRMSEIQMKKELAELSVSNRMLQQVMKETQALRQKCHQVCEKLANDRKLARTQLMELSVKGAAATKKLQETITKGEKVLRVAELCHTLERKLQLPTVERGETSGEFEELHHRMNVALLHREQLRKQQQDLRQENQQLEVQLQQSSDGQLCPQVVLPPCPPLAPILQPKSSTSTKPVS